MPTCVAACFCEALSTYKTRCDILEATIDPGTVQQCGELLLNARVTCAENLLVEELLNTVSGDLDQIKEAKNKISKHIRSFDAVAPKITPADIHPLVWGYVQTVMKGGKLETP